MKRLAVLAVVLAVTLACSQVSNPTANVSPRQTASPSNSAHSPIPTLASCVAATSYGLLIANGNLEVIDTCGRVSASTSIAASSVGACSPGLMAKLRPPVSATRDKVYFRDGDTKIRSLGLDGKTSDVTTVPGGPSTVSFFSVSPDDQRIAVLVEDFSPVKSINLRLYVEDLWDGAHHADIYTSTVSKSGGTTLWPMGWHRGLLTIALMTACGLDQIGDSPTAWHVVDPTSARRVASLEAVNCGKLNLWPSPAGMACSEPRGIGLYDWNGKMLGGYSTASCATQVGLSPSGKRWFYFVTPVECRGRTASPMAYTFVAGSDAYMGLRLDGRAACLWIDNDHLLAPDSILSLALPGYVSLGMTDLPTDRICAGRFPEEI
ncbi:MAG: hypothetical protein E6I27_18000 [Chloroflexi bacterium]|nr:MAG: hypothetical protein E6I27_18000 [Chloroflexota bacterium]